MARRFLGTLLGWGFVVLAGCAPGSELEEDGEDADRSSHRLEVRPGDPVALDRAIVIAPAPQSGVYAEVLLGTGETRVLHLSTDGASVVTLHEDGADSPTAPESADAGGVSGEAAVTGEAAKESTKAGAFAPCQDTASNGLPYRMGARLDWWFNAGSTPASTSVDAAEAALRRAASNITHSKNSCGLVDEVGVGHKYLGRTTKAAQINADATCKPSGNGMNTVGFGLLPEGILGLACVFYDGSGQVTEADVRFNRRYAWYATEPDGCSKRFSIEAVATHEFGHVFGLGHVPEDEHGNLTMSPLINGPCQSSESTLGRGDVLGLRAKY
jgi:hypothetical protein